MNRSLHLLLASLLLLLTGCPAIRVATPPPPVAGEAAGAACYVIYDAGSSGTRLFIYERQGTDWVEHAGPKVAALADPVRQNRGKTAADIPVVAAAVVGALDDLRHDGPADDQGRPRWQGFDWPRRCRLVSAMVYATAGMRIAEQEDRTRSAELWAALRDRLQARVGPPVTVQTRTLTGFEEGLFAWLAVRETAPSARFGIVEMGGASTQVTFPCARCKPADDAVRTVLVDGRPIQFYSHSFLGLGQDEAPRSLGLAPACAYGIGARDPHWTVRDCVAQIPLERGHGLIDPYNYQGHRRGLARRVPTHLADVGHWYLTGAFNYMQDGDINTCCRHQGACRDPEIACFRAVYLRDYLKDLKVSDQSERRDLSWTRGAVRCAEQDCLKAAPAPVCDWSDQGCL